MADVPFDDDPLIESLATLCDPRGDTVRSERTRARCHRILASRRKPARAWLAVFEAALLSALALLYLGGAVQRALILWGH